MSATDILAVVGAVTSLCGVLASILPQSWKTTKILTKIGAFTIRARTEHASN